jgi:Protein of unknown function (DUF4230)
MLSDHIPDQLGSQATPPRRQNPVDWFKAASTLWKAGVLLAALVIVGGAAALVTTSFQHQNAGIPKGVVLKKLRALGDYHAAQAVYTFNFTDVIHKGFWFFTGETIHVVGSGTDDAVVNFDRVEVIPQGPKTATIILPLPFLGLPRVNLAQTTLSEGGGLLTHLSHVINTYPNDSRKALVAAQSMIGTAAAGSDLLSRGREKTAAFMKRFLARLGYTKVTVNFV